MAGFFSATCVLVNRVNQVLNVTADGMQIQIEPGENPGFPRWMVPFAKRQNPLRGSGHPYNPFKFDSLVGVKGSKDNISPIEKMPTALETFDRTQMRGIGRHAVEIEGDPVNAFEARVAGIDGGGVEDVDGEAVALSRETAAPA